MNGLTHDRTAENFGEPKFLGAGTGTINYFQLATSRIGNLTWMIHTGTLLYIMTVHKYILITTDGVVLRLDARHGYHFLQQRS